MAYISIIIPVHNDAAEIARTVQGIFDTTKDGDCEIIVVNDCSRDSFKPDPRTVTIHNSRKLGVGVSRHIGSMQAKADWLLFMDAHMRFEPGWLDKAKETIAAGEASTLYCATVCYCESGMIDIVGMGSNYFGANLHVHGPHHKTGKCQTFDAIWAERKPDHNPEIQCVMGAGYFIHAFEFTRLSPLEHLRAWGMDEEMLSLKTWLSGGSVRLLSDVRLGHVWRTGRKLPYTLFEWEKVYNKLFAIYTLLPPEMASKLVRKIPRSPAFCKAAGYIKHDWHIVEIEQRRNEKLFTRDFNWFIERFGLSFPE